MHIEGEAAFDAASPGQLIPKRSFDAAEQGMIRMDLLGYALNALPDEERASIESELARRPELRAEVLRLRRQQIAPLRLDHDIEPPEGLAERTCARARGMQMSQVDPSERSSSGSLRRWDVLVATSFVLLVGLLFWPAAFSARASADRLACADQLRQLGIAIASYRQIERGQLPSADVEGPLAHAGVVSLLLKAQGLLPEARLLICPTADQAIVYVPRLAEYLASPLAIQRSQQREMGGSYGYSLGYTDDEGDYCRWSELDDDVPIVSDRPPREGEDTTSGNSPNHFGAGQNVLFADGRVSWIEEPGIGGDQLFANSHGKIAAGVGPLDRCLGVSEAFPNIDP